jgi:NAD(P)H-dependent FMN reductase
MARVLVFAGSARQASLNHQLARLGAEARRAAGADATLVDLGDYPMPIYHGDLEAADGVPTKAIELGQLIRLPENNASVSSLLKNTIDWLSRIREFDPLSGKSATLMAASPGAFGGVRGLYQLRAILNTLGVEVIAQQFLLPRAHQAFASDGEFVDPKQADQLSKFAQRFVRILR